jgi:hypothetical protein
MHDANQQAAHGKARAVFMVVRGYAVRTILADMRVGVDMRITFIVTVDMNMDAFANQPVDDVTAKGHKHDADNNLKTVGDNRVNRAPRQHHGAGKDAEGRHVAYAPDGAMTDDLPPVPGIAACHRGQVVGLKGVLHAKQQPEKNYPCHRGLVFFGRHNPVAMADLAFHHHGAEGVENYPASQL